MSGDPGSGYICAVDSNGATGWFVYSMETDDWHKVDWHRPKHNSAHMVQAL